ncbi:hypothetical protein PCCS19_58960 [Paenibacillus sp. CCS19]|nr:hypothetical protein PCCS19_58960 [Paenibacillus cellulosilyticus]
MAQAKKLYLANDQEGAYANVAKGEAKLLAALNTKGASDPKYGTLLASSGYHMSTVLHPTNTGVKYVRTFTSDIPCGEAGCQGVPLSAIMLFNYTDGSISTIRSHIVPLPGDQGEVEPFFLHVLTQYGLFRTTAGDIIMLSVLGNWRGGGWSIGLRNLSKGGSAEPYTTLFQGKDLPEELLKHWDETQQGFLGLCDARETVNCTVQNPEQITITAIDEDAGTVTFGTEVVHLSNVVNVKTSTERGELRKLINTLLSRGTFEDVPIRPGEQIVAAPQLGEPLGKRSNLLFYRNFTLQTDAIGEVKHIYYPARLTGLQSVTLAWLEKQLGTASVNKGSSSSVSVVIQSKYNLSRLTFTASNRNSTVQTIRLSGPLADETKGMMMSAIGPT